MICGDMIRQSLRSRRQYDGNQTKKLNLSDGSVTRLPEDVDLTEISNRNIYMPDPVILIDVLNLCFRMHFSHQHLQADGRYTGLTYGVLRTIHDLRQSVSPRMLMVWDHGIPVLGAARPKNWREEVLPSYKANRKRDNDNADYKIVVGQLADIYSIICRLGYTNISVMGLEADDLIGILSQTLKTDVLIFSTDQDFKQLLSTRVKILVPKKEKGSFRIVTGAEIEIEYGVPVARWAEYLALGGDSSDNIKPMRGMGPKTAIKLLKMGADLKFGFRQQPVVLRNTRPELEAVWEDILKSHYAARIPVDWRDKRIKSCLDAAGVTPYTFASLNPDPVWPNEDAKVRAKRVFETFLADREMHSLLSVREQFFTITDRREHTCPPPSPVVQRRQRLI